MKKVEAIIKPFKLSLVKEALHEGKWSTGAYLLKEVLSGQHFQNGTFYVNQGIATRPPSSRRRLKV